MARLNPLTKLFKSLTQLGLTKMSLFGRYQLGLRTGHYRRVTPSERSGPVSAPTLAPIAAFPDVPTAQADLALTEADEILRGKVRLFGTDPVPLDLDAGASPLHWSKLERIPAEKDLKLIWEPGRFGWAITLARAYAFSGETAYAKAFWENTLHFLDAHPPNLGRQWQSAQEVALRLMALVFCDQVLVTSPESTPERRQRLWQAVAEHARRIPPTLVYARAQNNNHLLSEAAGLYTAGLYLGNHPEAVQWRHLGWRWLNWGFLNQIEEFGTYVQQSVTYHRLMLQLALFTDALRREAGEEDWPEATYRRLAGATRWLRALTDLESGRVPNLGANDGAYIFPLASQPFDDFRPVVGAAARAFLDESIPEFDAQGEMAAWFGLEDHPPTAEHQPQAFDNLRVNSCEGRAFLHTAHFTDRPSHADQLHVDLWWRGVNVAQDAGTYSYNAPKPWDNALADTMTHNTLMLDGREQMQRAGRFLWLDWAQAEILAYEMDDEGPILQLVGEHDGYRRQGALHQRLLEATDAGWCVTDQVLSYGELNFRAHNATVHWLLPDWPWDLLTPNQLQLTGPDFGFTLTLSGVGPLSIVRAGERLLGDVQPEPTWGWTSPTYTVKQPALSVIASVNGQLPLRIVSDWAFSSVKE
jgi:hypothetical protein